MLIRIAPQNALPKLIDVKSVHEIVHEQEHEAVHHKNEKPKCEDDQRRHEQEQDRTEKSIKDPEEQGGADEGSGAIIANSARSWRRRP